MIENRSVFAALSLCVFFASCATKPPPPAAPAPSDPVETQDWSGVTGDFSVTSTPAGAAVKLSSGEKCKTPCSVKRPITEHFDVVISKNGFKTKTVTVISHQNVVPGSASTGRPKLARPHLSPNPVAVTLEPSWDR